MIHDHPGTSFVLGCDDEVAPILRRVVVRREIDHEKTEDFGVVVVVNMLPEVSIGRGGHDGIIVTVPPIGPLSGPVLVLDPHGVLVLGRTVEDHILDRVVHDELVVGRDVVVVVGHASIVSGSASACNHCKNRCGQIVDNFILFLCPKPLDIMSGQCRDAWDSHPPRC